MANFMANLLSGGSKGDKTSLVDTAPRPSTPTRQGQRPDFLDPQATPQGSPSKRTTVPGAHDLPSAFDNALKLSNAPLLESPVKLTRPQSVVTPLSPGKSNAQPLEDSFTSNIDDSVVHKSGGGSPVSPLKKQGQENTPPPSRLGIFEASHTHNHAALSRHEVYQTSRPTTPAKKFNTARGLTPEELEILKKPNVRRMVNVTQLCMCFRVVFSPAPS